MGRPRKETVSDEWKDGSYTVTKPFDQYVVRVGDSVVYASASRDDVKKYLDLVSRYV